MRPSPDLRELRMTARVVLCAFALLSMVGGMRAQQALSPRLADVFTKGVEAQKAGRLDEAEKDFLHVLQQGGNLAFVYNNLGALYQQRGDHKRAIQQFREAIRLNPDYAAPRILMGASLLATGEIPEARRQLKRAVELQPQEPLARMQLARAYERAGNPHGAVEQYRELVRLSPHEPEYTYQLSRAYQRFSEWCYQQITRNYPGSARAFQALGENYQMQGKPDAARRAYQLALKADPKLLGIHLALAQICLEQGKEPEARAEVEQELTIVPESALALALKKKLEIVDSSP
jgi:tetratricopeptide (TPR) repeat protein